MLESFVTLIFRVELLACEGRRLFFCVLYRRCGRLVSAHNVRTIISKFVPLPTDKQNTSSVSHRVCHPYERGCVIRMKVF